MERGASDGKKVITELQERIQHFQWIVDCLEGKAEEFYVEKDWYESPTLISKEDAKKEVEQTQKELERLCQKSVVRKILQLLHRIFQR